MHEVDILLVVVPHMLGWMLGGLCEEAKSGHVNWRLWHEESSYHVGSLVEAFPRGRLVFEQTCSNLCVFEGRLFQRFASWWRVVMHALYVVGLSPTNALVCMVCCRVWRLCWEATMRGCGVLPLIFVVVKVPVVQVTSVNIWWNLLCFVH